MAEMIEAKTLSSAYAADEAAANSKYANQKLRISGNILFKGKSNGGDPMLMFDRPDGIMHTVSAYFSPELKPVLDALSGKVTVEGVCRNFEGGTLIEIRECTVIP